MPSWNVIFYEDESGHSPVRDYLNELPVQQRAIVIDAISRLRQLGSDIQATKMDKLIEGSIRELRKDRHRILYGQDRETFVLLSAFLKRTQKTPQNEIRIAKERFENYKKQKKG